MCPNALDIWRPKEWTIFEDRLGKGKMLRQAILDILGIL